MNKIKWFVPIVILLSTFAKADNINYFCGNGKDDYSVDDAQFSLVIQDDKMDIYFSGQADPDYIVQQIGDTYSAKPQNQSGDDPKAEFLFRACQDQTEAEMGSWVVPTSLIHCNCTQE